MCHVVKPLAIVCIMLLSKAFGWDGGGGNGISHLFICCLFVYLFIYRVQISTKTESSFVLLGGFRVTFNFAITFPQTSLSVLV